MQKLFNSIAVIALVLSFFVFVPSFHTASKRAGGTTNYDILDVSDGYKVDGTTVIDGSGNVAPTSTFTLGTNGTALTELKSGTCTIFAYATTIAASSSAQVDCQANTTGGLTAISGIQSGDRVFASLASTTVAASNGLAITWVAASTTPGYITLKISNLTGTTFTWASTASSSVPYLVVR